MKQILLIFLTCYSISTFAKVETDTITNWKMFKDQELLFAGNEYNNSKIGVINLKVGFENLKFNIFYDFYNNITNKKIELIIDNRVIKSFIDKNYSNTDFIINVDDIYSFLMENNSKLIVLKYYDDININGLLIGKLKIEV